jgi:PAS domain S-box-containing protein
MEESTDVNIRLPAQGDGTIADSRSLDRDVNQKPGFRLGDAECNSSLNILDTLLESSPDCIYFKDLESRLVCYSQSYARKLEKNFPGWLIGKTDFDLFTEDHARPAYKDEQWIINTGGTIKDKLEKETYPDRKPSWALTSKRPWRDTNGKIIGTFGISKDVTSLQEAQANLEAANLRLAQASRLAGMAEVASDVLHNVGNVLNSVNISCSVVMTKTRELNLDNLSKAASLIRSKTGNLEEFFSIDPKGKRLLEYFETLSAEHSRQKEQMIKELAQLQEHIDHIKRVVSMQQNYAKVSGVHESVSVEQLLRDAVQINRSAMERHHIVIREEYTPMPPILVDKHRVLQILVNLVSNAKHAVTKDPKETKEIVLRIKGEDGGFVSIQVSDNGMGIAPENLTKIFAHGFTTRVDGHGFGLHSGAIAAKELGGSLAVESQGTGKGATFTLRLPLKPHSKSDQ